MSKQDYNGWLREEKADLEEKIATPAYVTIRPWLRIKLSAVNAAIRKLEDAD